MSLARYAQTARNSLQATRINAVGQVRNMFGGGMLSLQENGEGNNQTPPAEGFQGPLGMWNFPIISKITGGGGFGIMQSPNPVQTRLAVPSNVASQGGTRGVQTDMRDPAYGFHIY